MLRALPHRRGIRDGADRGQDTEVTGRRSSTGEAALAGVLALVLALAGSACWPHRVRAEQLRDGARSLLPPTGSVVVEEEGDCVELAPSPSCLHLYFVAERAPLTERVAAVEETARRAGWTLETKELLSGAASLRFRRGGLRAIVYLWREKRAARCRERPEKGCADTILVERAS
jgi:hypothetical protein